MTAADAASGTDPSPPPPTARPLDTVIDEVARFWKQAARSSRLVLDGTYTLNDAASDIDSWVSASTACALRLAAGLGGGRPPVSTYSGKWSAKMTVLPSVSQRPLTLRTPGLRAIGKGNATQIPPSAVTFVPEVLDAGENTFTVTVSFGGTPSPTTLIFEGDVLATDTGTTPVADRVRPNNRDGGPLR